MGRLIDTDNLLFLLNSAKEIREKLHRNTYYLDTMIEAINNEPTAYDPDKVVEQLEDYGNEETHYYKNTPYEKCIEECIGKAIEFVKGGGINDNTD